MLRRSSLWLVAAAFTVGAGWALLLWRGDAGWTSREESEVLAGVCDALAASVEGGDAGAVFYDRAHDDLHDLAADTAALDRAVAGRLLRSKERVEALLDATARAKMTTALRELSDATAAAVAVVEPGLEQMEACP